MLKNSTTIMQELDIEGILNETRKATNDYIASC
jgi:hypothetical protein